MPEVLKQGVAVPVSDLLGVTGRALLNELSLDPPYAARVRSLPRLIEAFDFEIDVVTTRLRNHLARDPDYSRWSTTEGGTGASPT